MKKYLMLILFSLTAVTLSALDVKEYWDSIDSDFFYLPQSDTELLKVIDGFIQNVKNPFEKHRMQIDVLYVNMTILDLMLFCKLGMEEQLKDDEVEGDFEIIYLDNVNRFIPLLQEHGFHQTISDKQLNKLVTLLNTPNLLDCLYRYRQRNNCLK